MIGIFSHFPDSVNFWAELSVGVICMESLLWECYLEILFEGGDTGHSNGIKTNKNEF